MTYIPTQEVQQESVEEQQKQTLLLQKVEKHLSTITDLELKEEDVNDN